MGKVTGTEDRSSEPTRARAAGPTPAMAMAFRKPVEPELEVAPLAAPVSIEFTAPPAPQAPPAATGNQDAATVAPAAEPANLPRSRITGEGLDRALDARDFHADTHQAGSVHGDAQSAAEQWIRARLDAQGATLPEDGMVRFCARLLAGNLSQIDLVATRHGGRYADIGHAERFMGLGIGFEEIQLRNLTYFAYLHTVEEGADCVDVGVKVLDGLNGPRGLPVPAVVRFDYHGTVPGARDRAIARARRVEAAVHARFPDLIADGRLHTARMVRAFAEAGLTPTARMDLGSNEAIKHAAIAGLGLAVLSLHSLSVEGVRGPLTVLDVEDFPIQRRWWLVHGRGRDLSPAAAAGDAVLARLGLDAGARRPCRVAWTETIRAISPDHAVLINRQDRRGSMVLPGQSLFILETEPAGYVMYAAAEAAARAVAAVS